MFGCCEAEGLFSVHWLAVIVVAISVAAAYPVAGLAWKGLQSGDIGLLARSSVNDVGSKKGD